MTPTGRLTAATRMFVAALFIAVLAPYTAAEAQDGACRPAAAPPVEGHDPQQRGATEARPERAEIWLDGSASMRGFITRADGRRRGDHPLFDIVGKLPNLFADFEVATGLHRFGSDLDPDIGLATFRGATTPAFYGSRYNQNSKPWLPLADSLRRGGVTVIVSDLFLDDGDVVGDTSAMAAPLTTILRRGWSVNLVGIASRFSGTVYDLPNQPDLALQDGWMPLYVMIVGPRDQVAWTTRVLKEEVLDFLDIHQPHDMPPGAVHIARFGQTAEVGAVTTAEILRQDGAVQFPRRGEGLDRGSSIGRWLEDVVRVSVDPRDRWRANNMLRVLVDVPVAAPQGVRATITPGTPEIRAWRLVGDATAMRCATGARWLPANGAPIVAGVRSAGSTVDITLFPPQAPLRANYSPGQLTMVRIAVPLADLTIRNTSADWMSPWSFAGSEAGAARAKANRMDGFMPTLNLADLRRTLHRIEAQRPAGGRPADPVAVLDVAFALSTD